MGKKVAIMSMQRVINYGSFLQAYGLKTLLEEQGHTVEFVDIKPGQQRDFGKREIEKIGYKRYTGLKRLLAVMDKYFIKRCIGQLYQKQLVKLFRQKHQQQLGMTAQPVTDVPCDTLVIGSDEVFNCAQATPWGVATCLLGDYPMAQRVITYAASCGFTTSADLPEDVRQTVRDCFSKISAFSVRDSNTHNFVQSLSDQEIMEHLDPVLAADFSGHRKTYRFNKPYLLVYAYTNRINLPEEIKAIQTFAKKHGLKTVSVGGYQCWCDYNLLVEPLELFDVFQGAAYVVTDTFHGTVIAAKMNTPFATIVRESNRNKLEDLIRRLGMQRRMITDISDLEQVLLESVDFEPLNAELARQRVLTQNYLKNNV